MENSMTLFSSFKDSSVLIKVWNLHEVGTGIFFVFFETKCTLEMYIQDDSR